VVRARRKMNGRGSESSRRGRRIFGYRLGRIAKEALDSQAPLWERLRGETHEGVTSEGFLLPHVNELGWMESREYAEVARRAVETQIRQPLLSHGIRVP
jgi:hypothetical protein